MQTGQIRGSTLPCLLQSGEGFFLESDFAYKLRIGGARAQLLPPLRLRLTTTLSRDVRPKLFMLRKTYPVDLRPCSGPALCSSQDEWLSLKTDNF